MQKENVVVRHVRHSRMSLSGIPTAINNTQGGDPRLQSSGMTTKEEALHKNTFRAPLRSGFTLIELLIVVLIIGILAAVALPQYQKAITKSRAMKMINLLRAHIPVWENFYLEHGRNPSSFNELELQLPADWTDTKKLYITTGPANKEMTITYQPTLNAVQIGFISGPYRGGGFAYFFSGRVGGGANYGTVPAKEIVCSEYRTASDTPFKLTKGDFCKKIFGGNKTYDSGADVYFRISL